MGIYNFQSRFVPFILAGTKTHTIRALRAHPDKPGNTLYLYTGLRHPGARLLMQVPCVRVEQISIYRSPRAKYGYTIRINGQALQPDEISDLANSDGFECFADMLAFWRGRLPFTGQIIHWEAPPETRNAVVSRGKAAKTDFRLFVYLEGGMTKIICDHCRGGLICLLPGENNSNRLVEAVRSHRCPEKHASRKGLTAATAK